MKLSRRGFLNTMAASIAGMPLASIPVYGNGQWRPVVNPTGTVETMGSARNLIFIHLQGGPSHVDTFDLKTGSWTPDALGATTLSNGWLWPQGTMPKLAQRAHMFSILRSLIAVEPVHERASYHLLTSYRQNPSTVADVPHLGSMLSLLMEARREAHHVLPLGVTLNRGIVGKGKLPVDYALARVDGDGSVPNLNHIWPNMTDRFALLNQNATLATGDGRTDYNQILQTAQKMSLNEDLKAYNNNPNLPQVPQSNYFYTNVYQQQALAGIRLLSAGLGTRIVVMNWFGWDSHVNIYSTNNGANIMNLSTGFDDAMAYLLDSLKGLPGENGDSLLDETLVVAAGEFGRTVGNVDNNAGRDHYPYVTPVFLAGGGIQSGRTIGATSAKGDYVEDLGWNKGRPIGIGDLTATIYSALGCNWHAQVQYTPTGRIYDLIDTRETGPLDHVEPLFV